MSDPDGLYPPRPPPSSRPLEYKDQVLPNEQDELAAVDAVVNTGQPQKPKFRTTIQEQQQQSPIDPPPTVAAEVAAVPATVVATQVPTTTSNSTVFAQAIPVDGDVENGNPEGSAASEGNELLCSCSVKKRNAYWILIFVVVVAGVVVVVVVGFIQPGVFLNEKDEESPDSSNSSTVAPSTVVPTMEPSSYTTIPTVTPTSKPTRTTMPSTTNATSSPTPSDNTTIDKSNVPIPTPSTISPTLRPSTSENTTRADGIIDFIQNNTFSQNQISSSCSSEIISQEQAAVCWLINKDLNVTAESENLLQRFVLLTFLGNMLVDIPENTNDPWIRGNECETWGFVTCDDNRIATSLDLGSFNFKIQNLTGTIPADVALLSSLETLDLTHNGINGEIPRELWALTKLTALALGNENLTGSFPAEMELNWTNLVFLDLSHISVLDDNGDIGIIPSTVWSLTKLKYLDISGMNVTPGPFPSTAGQLSMLLDFKASSSNFKETLPDEIGLWSNLQVFDISDNFMTGTIPSTIANWKNIKIALFNGNNFVGTFPDGFCTISTLQEFNADCNQEVLEALQCSADCTSKIDRKSS